MSERHETDVFGAPMPDIAGQFPPLPSWLAARHLGPFEKVTWVAGPRFNPSWERYVTHPTLFLGALAIGAVCMAAGWLFAGLWEGILVLAVLIAVGLVFGSIIVLGLFCGHFTRLVATTDRLMILQGYELCRTWAIDDLPRSMIRRHGMGHGDESRTLDLDAMKTMLGGSSDAFVEAKTILNFGKQLGQIKSRENERE
jgi:hypothetical protein